MKVREKPVKLGALIKELDKWVSLYVRLNAADQNGTVNCISCNTRMWWADSQCAHNQDRDNMATRYHLDNLAPACEDCNVYNHYWHIGEWDKKLTEQQRKTLGALAHSMVKYTRPELEELISDFKAKVESIKKQKGL